MHFDEEFFKNEVREGFFVSSMMKRAWAAQIEILEDFDNLCKENNIRYFGAYGTLLGAVRHGGFIPWDDDIDIWMLREDCEKLRKLAKEKDLPGGYILKTPYSEKEYMATFDRIINFYSIGFNEERLEKYHGFPFCAGLDIFPLDYVPSGRKYDEFKEDMTTLIQLYGVFKSDPKSELNKRMRELLKAKFDYKINTKENITNQIVKMYEKCIKKYCSTKSDKLARVYGWGAKGFKESGTLKTEWFENTEYIQFENFKLPAPSQYHDVLESQYKNHMVSVRAYEDLHDYPFYKKQDTYFYESVNKRITSREYDKEEMEKIQSSTAFKEASESILEKTQMLGKINDVIIKLIDANDASKVFDLLEKSQEIAIKLGNTIEERYLPEKQDGVISDLEKYCENLYNMSVGLNEDSDKFIESLKDNLALAETIKTKIDSIIKLPNIKKIVFIFESEKDWKKYEPIYKKLSCEKNLRCYAVPIPYFLMDSHLKISEDTLKYEGENIKSDIDFYDYQTFEYESIDCVIKSNAYDNSSYGDIIRPFFFSYNLHKFCKKIVHIPTLGIMDFDSKDVQMTEMADCFVKAPGVLYSDYVILDSQTNTETYKKILNEFSDSTDWDNKVIFGKDETEIAKLIQNIANE